jgi:hypothetical protein
MKKLGLGFAILILGAAALSPAVAYLGLDPMPGDVAIRHAGLNLTIPVAYSLCASGAMGLLYYFLKG